MDATAGGQSERISVAGTGVLARWLWTNSLSEEHANGGWPTRSSYSVAPREYRSLRTSTERPSRPVCSGER